MLTVVAVELRAHRRRQLVEPHELVHLGELNLVPVARCVAFIDHLRDVGKDGGGTGDVMSGGQVGGGMGGCGMGSDKPD